MTEINNLTDQNGFVISILKYSIMIVSLHLEKTLAIVSKIRTIQVELNTANELRIFRVTIAADLKWSTYASNLRALVNKMVSFLNLFGCTLNVTICLKIFNSLCYTDVHLRSPSLYARWKNQLYKYNGSGNVTMRCPTTLI